MTNLKPQDWQKYHQIIRELETFGIINMEENAQFLKSMCKRFNNRKTIAKRLIKLWIINFVRIHYSTTDKTISAFLILPVRDVDHIIDKKFDHIVTYTITLDKEITNWLFSTGWIVPCNMSLDEMFYQQALGTINYCYVHLMITEKCPYYNYVSPYKR